MGTENTVFRVLFHQGRPPGRYGHILISTEETEELKSSIYMFHGIKQQQQQQNKVLVGLFFFYPYWGILKFPQAPK